MKRRYDDECIQAHTYTYTHTHTHTHTHVTLYCTSSHIEAQHRPPSRSQYPRCRLRSPASQRAVHLRSWSSTCAKLRRFSFTLGGLCGCCGYIALPTPAHTIQAELSPSCPQAHAVPWALECFLFVRSCLRATLAKQRPSYAPDTC